MSWAYWRPIADGIVELAALRGREVGLPVHFHDEDQVTLVLEGRRRFVIGGEVVALEAGQAVLIPAGVPHSSLPEALGVVCTNAYLLAGDYAVAPMLREVERLYRNAGTVGALELALVLREYSRDGRRPSSDGVMWGRYEPVSRMAARAGMSREGFSRNFAARCGMPPHAFWLMGRLNHARALLRAGEAIAEAAS